MQQPNQINYNEKMTARQIGKDEFDATDLRKEQEEKIFIFFPFCVWFIKVVTYVLEYSVGRIPQADISTFLISFDTRKYINSLFVVTGGC